MPDFESKQEEPLNMCETVKLCQEEDSDHYDVTPRGNYSNFLDEESSCTEGPIDELSGRGYRQQRSSS